MNSKATVTVELRHTLCIIFMYREDVLTTVQCTIVYSIGPLIMIIIMYSLSIYVDYIIHLMKTAPMHALLVIQYEKIIERVNNLVSIHFCGCWLNYVTGHLLYQLS